MAAVGVLDYEHLELIDGELISKIGKNRLHARVGWSVVAWLIEIFGVAFVQTESPIDVAAPDNEINEPVPDVLVLNRSFKKLAAKPGPADVHLVVEVSDTSLRFDLTTKAALYARAEIVEYWVVDISAKRIIVHLGPLDGRYQSVVAYSEWESVTPLASPGAALSVGSPFAIE